MEVSIPAWLGGVADDVNDVKVDAEQRQKNKESRKQKVTMMKVDGRDASPVHVPSEQEKEALHILRLKDGDLGLGFSLMVLDSTVEEGQEFLRYVFPAATPQSVRMIGMRMSFSLLDAVMDSIAHQPVRLVKFVDRDGGHHHLSVCCIALSGSMEGCLLVFATWLPVPDAILPRLVLTLLDYITVSVGPLKRNDFVSSDVGSIDAGDMDAEEKNEDENVSKLSMSFAAMAKLDPVIRQFGVTFFQGDAEGWFLSTFASTVPWFHPSVRLVHSLSTILSHLESSPREHADAAVLPNSSSSSASSSVANLAHSRSIRACHTVGATLYFKTVVVASHLAQTALKSTTTFLQMRGLLRKSDSEPTKASFHKIWIDPSSSGEVSVVVDRLCGTSDRQDVGNYVLSVVNMGELTLALLLKRIPSIPVDNALDPFFFVEMRETMLGLMRDGVHVQIERDMQRFHKHLVSPVHTFSIQGSDAPALKKEKTKNKSAMSAIANSKRESSSDLHSSIFDFVTVDIIQGTIVYGHSEDAVLPLIRTDFVKVCVQLQAQLDVFVRDESKAAWGGGAVFEDGEEPKFRFDGHAMIDVMGIVSELAVKRTSVVHTSDPMDESKNSTRAVCYWVVARKYSSGATCFICYEDGAVVPHHVVELAFRLSFSVNRG